jgi:LL-diaminopimelate aminotransferase
MPDMISLSKKTASVKPYYFFNLQQKIDQLKASGKDILRLDIGSPDLPPPPEVIDALVESARRPDTHGYTPNRGPLAYREALAKYYQDRFGVILDPEKEVLPLLGSKEGIINLHQVIIDPGDEVLVPNPGYPSYRFAAEYAGGTVREYSLIPAHQYLPDNEEIKGKLSGRTKILWINYPNNPTGATIQLETMQALVNLALEKNFFIVHDAPYSDIYYEKPLPPSILSIPGAKDIAVEINSLSKTFHMAGWRIGMICGNRDIIQAIQVLKSKVDNSTAAPIFSAAIRAFSLKRDWIEERNQVMKKRRDIFCTFLNNHTAEFSVPKAGFYIWAKIPQAYPTAADFCDKALMEAGVSMTPGYIYGTNGNLYYRVSLCQPQEILSQAIERLQVWTK